jgi:hypothetical protein
MSVLNQKQAIFSDISARKTLTEGFPKLDITSSFPSISNDLNPLNFLTDLLSTLVGVETLKEVIVETLSHNLEGIEDDIKKLLKKELNRIISCDINPSIPDVLLNNSSGVDLEMDKLDFMGLFLMDPYSPSGELLFTNIEDGVHSTDFNSYLYSTIQSEEFQSWGKSTIGENIFDIKFKENGSTNNVINVKVSDYYSDPKNKKKLKDLNNDYIDSIDLFDASELITKIVDNVFGTISTDQNKSKKQLMAEAKLNAIIDDIINQDDDQEIDNSFFEFDNNKLAELELQVENQYKGVKVVNTSSKYEVKTSVDTVRKATKDIKSGDKLEMPGLISGAIDQISNDITKNIPKIDQYAVKLDFIQDIVKNLMKVIGGIILSPKLTTILTLNFKIIFGEVFKDPIDFIMKNKYFIKSIMNGIRDFILKLLLGKNLKEIEELAIKTGKEFAMEQISNTKDMIQSLITPLNDKVSNIKI